MCNLCKYLMEEELSCRRIARVANLDTPAGREWERVAGEMLRIRREHLDQCEVCQRPELIPAETEATPLPFVPGILG